MFKSPPDIWKDPPFASYLEADERVIAAIRAFSGLLGHPFVQSGPMWGSTLWEVALTDHRFLAVQRRLLPWPRRRKTMSIPLTEIGQVLVHWDWGMVANVRIQNNGKVYEVKVWGSPSQTYAFTREIQRIGQPLSTKG